MKGRGKINKGALRSVGRKKPFPLLLFEGKIGIFGYENKKI
jgi:hypothetical protein